MSDENNRAMLDAHEETCKVLRESGLEEPPLPEGLQWVETDRPEYTPLLHDYLEYWNELAYDRDGFTAMLTWKTCHDHGVLKGYKDDMLELHIAILQSFSRAVKNYQDELEDSRKEATADK